METVEIFVECIADTADAVLVSDGDKEVWIPRSQIVDDESEVVEKGDEGSLVIPEWLAKNEGLI